LADTGISIESAASYTRGGIYPGPSHEESPQQRAARALAEEQRLAQWASENKKIGNKLPEDAVGGFEHTALFDPETQRWVKSTRPGRFGVILVRGYALDSETGKWRESPESIGASAGEYLERISLANKLFHDDILLEYVVTTNDGLSIVTSQPNIVGEPATPDIIQRFMAEKGFEKIDAGMFYSLAEQVLVFDLFAKNVVLSRGKVAPIDPIIQRADPSFAAFLNSHATHL
jgi:hypothetical protein